ncbi:MAG: endonuclease [Marinilabiliales bacterium]
MKELNRILFVLSIIIFFSCSGLKQTNEKNTNIDYDVDHGDFRIMFYNCENFFDVVDDSLTRDEEFTPQGVRYWTNKKYEEKRNKIYKVITAVGGWEAPDIVGLCEIENHYVVEDLVKNTPLSKWDYRIVHKESPDRRGIDVVLLYRKESFKVIENEFIRIKFPDSDRKTRDVIYVKGKTSFGDTLYVFVNHWPSRWSGQLESEPARMFVASVVKNKTDSILRKNPNSKIILMGDFNDEPENKSLSEVLQANLSYDNIEKTKLYNLSYYLLKEKGLGTHKYQGTWGLLDQFIVSGSLLNNKGLHTDINHVHIFNKDFLLEKDETYVGYKPFRTFIGYKYNNGFSDHLPVYLDLLKK